LLLVVVCGLLFKKGWRLLILNRSERVGHERLNRTASRLPIVREVPGKGEWNNGVVT